MSGMCFYSDTDWFLMEYNRLSKAYSWLSKTINSLKNVLNSNSGGRKQEYDFEERPDMSSEWVLCVLPHGGYGLGFIGFQNLEGCICRGSFHH